MENKHIILNFFIQPMQIFAEVHFYAQKSIKIIKYLRMDKQIKFIEIINDIYKMVDIKGFV